MHTNWKTAVLNALLLTQFTAGPRSQCQFKAFTSRRGGFLDPKGPLSTGVPPQAIALQTSWWKGYRGQRPWWEARSVLYIHAYFTYSKLFHGVQSLELLEWRSHACVRNFGVRKCSLPVCLFLTGKLATWKFVTIFGPIYGIITEDTDGTYKLPKLF